jgi:hypothetical protein
MKYDTACRAMILSTTLLLTLGLLGNGMAQDKLRGPWPKHAAPGRQPTVETSITSLAARGALTAWHQVLTRADGPRSVMYPTASGFLGQAIAKHGLLIGIMMTTDRLMHEWDEQRRAPRIVVYGISRAYDPVEANDFWWVQPAD